MNNKENVRPIRIDGAFFEVVFQEASKNPGTAIINNLYSQKKLVIHAGPPELFRTKIKDQEKIADAVVGFSPVDPKGIGKESYIFLSLNKSVVPKIGEGGPRLERFRQTLERVSAILSVSHEAITPFAHENFIDENSLSVVMGKIFENKPNIVYIL